jgi:ketosteroid isomerase-like protein
MTGHGGREWVHYSRFCFFQRKLHAWERLNYSPVLFVSLEKKMKSGIFAFLIFLPVSLMAQSDNVTKEFLQSFADAFNAHDVQAIMSHMTYDCVFEASSGPDFNGEKFVGKEKVKNAFEEVFATFPDAQWSNLKHFVSGERGFSEWIFNGTKSDGTRVEVTGCDLFTFKDGKISVKNSYRKNRMPGK